MVYLQYVKRKCAKEKNIDIQRYTRVDVGCQFTSNVVSVLLIALRVDRFFRYMPNYCDMHFPNYFPFHFKVANSLYCRLSVNTAGACDLTLGVKGGCRPL